MRTLSVVSLLVLLSGCYDGATTTVALDVKAGTAHVVQRLHNAWPDSVGCDAPDSVESCVAGVRTHLEDARAELVTNGATVATAGVILADGKLDILYDYVAAVGAKALSKQDLTFLYLEDRTQGQVEKGKPGKKRVAMITLPISGGETTTTVEGKYRLLSAQTDEAALSVHVFRGKSASITSEWVYVPDAEGKKSPGAWLKERPGLEEALRASGMVVEPPV
ncbi:MAG: hypothetical protein Q8P18_34305 [Pseudomonadota bacterium]|nr:hypothetical protein [Pseudomonadota bacterium]